MLVLQKLSIDSLSLLLQANSPSYHLERLHPCDEADFDNADGHTALDILDSHVEIQCEVALRLSCGCSVEGGSIVYISQPISISEMEKVNEYIKLLKSCFFEVNLLHDDELLYGCYIAKMKPSLVPLYESLRKNKRLNKYALYIEETHKVCFEGPFDLYVCKNTKKVKVGNDSFVSHFLKVASAHNCVAIPLVGFNIQDIEKEALLCEFFSSFESVYIVSHNEYAVATYIMAHGKSA